eukprot:365643-Chlamydomonas_euryale.AAC.8
MAGGCTMQVGNAQHVHVQHGRRMHVPCKCGMCRVLMCRMAGSRLPAQPARRAFRAPCMCPRQLWAFRCTRAPLCDRVT